MVTDTRTILLVVVVVDGEPEVVVVLRSGDRGAAITVHRGVHVYDEHDAPDASRILSLESDIAIGAKLRLRTVA